jgi:hypothetical protein
MRKLNSILCVLFALLGLHAKAQIWQEYQKDNMLGFDSDYTSAQFGASIDVDGNYAVVGAPGKMTNRGEAQVFFYNGTNWEYQATLTAVDGVPFDYFGTSVAIDGDLIVVGAWGVDDNGGESGAAYVFEKPGATWVSASYDAKLTASDASEYDNHGQAVAIENNVVVVGADVADGAVLFAGAAYVYEEPVGGWVNATEDAKLTASDGSSFALFGFSVAIEGDDIVVGAIDDDGVATNAGACYVFTKSGANWTTMTQTAKLTASDFGASDSFGWSVDISGNVIAVSAPNDDDVATNGGSAYVFEKSGANWVNATENAKLTASSATSLDLTGVDLDIEGDNIVLGVVDFCVGFDCKSRALVYQKTGVTWSSMTESQILTYKHHEQFDEWVNVAISGDHLLIGNPNQDDVAFSQVGAFGDWIKTGTTWTNEFQNTINYPYFDNSNADFGYDVDIDGDYAIVGAQGNDSNTGVAHILFNDNGNWRTIANLTGNISTGMRAGWSVAIEGDVAVVGVWGNDNVAQNAGAVYVYQKPSNGWDNMIPTAVLTASDGGVDDNLGASVDIYNNVIVAGAPYDDDFGNSSGSVYIFTQPVGPFWTNTTETAKLNAGDAGVGKRFGYSVAINGDDVAVGSSGDNAQTTFSGGGSVYAFTKPGSAWVNMTHTAKFLPSDGGDFKQLGYDISIDGDYILGMARGDTENGTLAGAAYIFKKTGTGWVDGNEIAKLTASDGASGDELGVSGEIRGDLIVLGARGQETNELDGGAVYVYEKPQSGEWLSATENITLKASEVQDEDYFGHAVTADGDWLLSGAINDDHHSTDGGDVYIFNFCATYNSFSAAECTSYTVPSGDETYTALGNYLVYDTLQNFKGCDSILTINLTIEDAVAPVPDLVSLANVASECEVISLTAPTATDNCSGTITGTTTTTLPISGQGTTVVTWTYDDGNGNVTTQDQNVVINDVTAPAADVMNLPDLTAECALASAIAPTATDNCTGAVNATTNTSFPINTQGTTVISWTYDDGNGNVSTQTQNVVIDDITAPVPDVATLSDVTGECSLAAPAVPLATDNCSGAVTATTTTSFPITTVGTTVVTWTYDDGNGNVSTQDQNFIVTDNTDPVPDVASLPDLTAECEVTATPPTATDNCSGTITGTTIQSFPVTYQGTSVITWNFDDGNGNIVTQNQTVIIGDVTPPVPDVATLPDVIDGCNVPSLTPPTATDNCGGAVTVSNDATLPITAAGTTVVTWTYEDEQGNTSTQTQNVVLSGIDNSVTLNVITASAVFTVADGYQWLDCDNGYGPITGETNVDFNATANGNFAVEITDGSCVDTSDCVAITQVGIQEMSNLNLEVFPNPSTGDFNVQLNGVGGQKSVRVFSLDGRLIYSSIEMNDNFMISIDAADGTYILEVSTALGKVQRKIVVQ